MPKPPRKRPLAALLTGVYGQPTPEQMLQQQCGQYLQTVSKPLPSSAKTTIGLHTHTAMRRLMNGQAIPEDLAALALAANVSLLLCEGGLGPEHMADIVEAQQSIALLMRQMTDNGKPRPTGPMLTSLRQVLDISEAQLDSPDCTQAVIEACITEFKPRVSSGDIFEVTKD
jgi:hypothetical protein